MVDLNELKQRLMAVNLNLSDIELRSPRELARQRAARELYGVRRLPASGSPGSSGTYCRRRYPVRSQSVHLALYFSG